MAGISQNWQADEIAWPRNAPISQEITRLIATGIGISSTGFGLFTPDDTLAFASPAYAQIFDLQPAARTFSDIIRHCHRARTGMIVATDDIEDWLRTVNTKRRQAPERVFEIDLQDGRWFWATEVTFDGGWLMLTLSDITQLKANERTLRQARDAAIHWAETDALTGLHNRRFIMERLTELVQASRVSKASLCAALLDVDHFKTINDRHGHDAGDQVLQHFATVSRQAVRKSDFLARVGGEEFLLLMPGAEAADAFAVVDRLGEQIAQSWPLGQGVLRYTLSAGVVQLGAEDGQELYKRADQALYQAKDSGRNRVEIGLARAA